MQKKFLTFFFKNLKSIGLIFLIILTVTIAGYSNQKENLNKNRNNDFINNIYFKKTLNEIINNLEPRFKKYNHKIKSGENFNNIFIEKVKCLQAKIQGNQAFKNKKKGKN